MPAQPGTMAHSCRAPAPRAQRCGWCRLRRRAQVQRTGMSIAVRTAAMALGNRSRCGNRSKRCRCSSGGGHHRKLVASEGGGMECRL
jgi:hypothetical protein